MKNSQKKETKSLPRFAAHAEGTQFANSCEAKKSPSSWTIDTTSNDYGLLQVKCDFSKI